jgi:hypothetical protein
MRQKIYHRRVMWHLGMALTLAAVLCLISPSPASAQDLAEYFQLGYDPVTFDKQEINGGEVFYVTITGRATCTQDLPLSASEASITSQVIAVHTASGTTVTLNSSYTVTIKPFPSKEGKTAEISQSVPLQFPAQAESGDYNVIGKIAEAKVKVGFLPAIDVAGYLPQEQQMGMVKYTAPESPPIPESPPALEPESGSPPLKSYPTDNGIPAPQEIIAIPEPEQIIPWWVWLIVLLAAATIGFNIIWFTSHRAR